MIEDYWTTELTWLSLTFEHTTNLLIKLLFFTKDKQVVETVKNFFSTKIKEKVKNNKWNNNWSLLKRIASFVKSCNNCYKFLLKVIIIVTSCQKL